MYEFLPIGAARYESSEQTTRTGLKQLKMECLRVSMSYRGVLNALSMIVLLGERGLFYPQIIYCDDESEPVK